MGNHVSRDALYDLMERSNKIVSKVHAVGTASEKEAIVEIGKDINRKGRLTDLLVRYEEWLRSVVPKYMGGDAEASALLEEAKRMNDANPHTEWKR